MKRIRIPNGVTADTLYWDGPATSTFQASIIVLLLLACAGKENSRPNDLIEFVRRAFNLGDDKTPFYTLRNMKVCWGFIVDRLNRQASAEGLLDEGE